MVCELLAVVSSTVATNLGGSLISSNRSFLPFHDQNMAIVACLWAHRSRPECVWLSDAMAFAMMVSQGMCLKHVPPKTNDLGLLCYLQGLLWCLERQEKSQEGGACVELLVST